MNPSTEPIAHLPSLPADANAVARASYVTDASLRWIGGLLAMRLGLPLVLEAGDGFLLLRLPGGEGGIRFPCLGQEFARRDSDLPCASWNARAEGWAPPIADCLPAPGMERLPERLVEFSIGADCRFGYDLPGLMFWQFARVEEVGRSDLDAHRRFPAAASHARKHGYLDRPIVDEWLMILAQVVSRQWPSAAVRQARLDMIVSHDVDVPARYVLCSPGDWARRTVGALSRRRWREASGGLRTPFGFGPRIPATDPYNTYQWLMDQSEARGLSSTFYFMAGCTDPRFDTGYDPRHPAIRSIIRTAVGRGHGVGVHPSYGTHGSLKAIMRECANMREIVSAETGSDPAMGGRTHYLRWSQPGTPRAFASAGLVHDASLGYADQAGFRCGTCHPYPAFDPVAHEALPITIQPLVAMEGTVVEYMGMGEGCATLELFRQLKDKCRQVGGAFSFLWHNSELDSPERRSMYLAVLDS